MPEQKVVVVEEKPRGCMGIGIAMLGVLGSGAWLLNFTAGIVELPDMLPIFGNIDEAAAAAVFFSCLRYLGIDVLPFGRKQQVTTREIIDVTPASKRK
ncbi:MAG: DUF1232 domain-containing protein [Candidatus Hydrogenedentes bacterium]|nr:DUF1232 domain-containing protein [Candidatus Hydrogenedentota bacterium]